MPKLKVLSGRDVVQILSMFGFGLISQKGSHIKMQRLSDLGAKQSLTIPNHSELDKGTLKAIIRKLSQYITESDIRKHFYSE